MTFAQETVKLEGVDLRPAPLGTREPAEERHWILDVSILERPGTKLPQDPGRRGQVLEVPNTGAYAEGVYRRKTHAVNSTLVTTIDYGHSLGWFLFRLLGYPVPDLEIILVPLSDAEQAEMLTLEIWDRVRVEIPEVGVDADYIIESVRWSAGGEDSSGLQVQLFLSPFVSGSPRLNFSPLAPFPQLTFIDFDGSNDRVTIGSFDALTDPNVLTLEAWIRPDSVTTRMTVFDNSGVDTAGHFQVEVGQPRAGDPGRVVVIIPGTFVVETVDDVLTAGKWHHIAYVRDGSGATHKIYVDGAEVALATNGTNAFTDGNEAKVIGARGSSQWFDGIIADVRLWDVARTAEDVSRDHDEILEGDEAGLVGWWPLNEPSGTDALSWAGPGKDGVYAGTPARAEFEWLQLSG